MYKRILTLLFIAVCLFAAGCSKTTLPEKGDFTFQLPEGYRVGNITDLTCDIIRNEDETAVGAIEVTALSRKDLKDTQTKKVMRYLQEDFHETNNVEFYASNWGHQNPIVIITLTRYNADRTERHDFYHAFFEKDACVYHMWFDLERIDWDIPHDFLYITGVDS